MTTLIALGWVSRVTKDTPFCTTEGSFDSAFDVVTECPDDPTLVCYSTFAGDPKNLPFSGLHCD